MLPAGTPFKHSPIEFSPSAARWIIARPVTCARQLIDLSSSPQQTNLAFNNLHTADIHTALGNRVADREPVAANAPVEDHAAASASTRKGLVGTFTARLAREAGRGDGLSGTDDVRESVELVNV